MSNNSTQYEYVLPTSEEMNNINEYSTLSDSKMVKRRGTDINKHITLGKDVYNVSKNEHDEYAISRFDNDSNINVTVSFGMSTLDVNDDVFDKLKKKYVDRQISKMENLYNKKGDVE